MVNHMFRNVAASANTGNTDRESPLQNQPSQIYIQTPSVLEYSLLRQHITPQVIKGNVPVHFLCVTTA